MPEPAPLDRRRARAWAAAWTAVAAGLLLLRVPQPIEALAAGMGELALDKLAHVALFFAVARSWLAAAPGGGRARIAAIVAAAAVYGGLLELAQPYFAREAEGLDLVADAAGAALAPLRRPGAARAAL